MTYHSQQDPDWCDPADIEMWLQADGVALPSGDEHAIQQQFWFYETADNDGYTIAQWNASPYAVASTLNYYGGWTDIGDDPEPSAAAAGAVISYSLDVLHQPVIVMVGAGTHYVLVTGVELSSAGPDAPPLEVTVDDPLAYGVGASSPGRIRRHRGPQLGRLHRLVHRQHQPRGDLGRAVGGHRRRDPPGRLIGLPGDAGRELGVIIRSPVPAPSPAGPTPTR